MTRRADVPDVMARVAAALDDAERAPTGAGGVLVPVPEGDPEVNVGRLRHLAEVEVEFPSGSDRPFVGAAVRLTKRAVRRGLRWYIGPIVEQQSRFNHATLDLIERLRLRVTRTSGAGIAPLPVPETPLLETRWQPYADVDIRFAAYVPWFRGCRRVVHVDCGKGELLRGLAAEGTAAYGVTLDESVVPVARARGAEVVVEDPEAHLRGLAPESVDGFFWSLLSAPRPASDLVAILKSASAVLAPHAVVVVETAGADDLLPGAGIDGQPARPLHPGAVRAALEATGFSGVRVEVLAPSPPPAPESSLAEEIERLDDLLTRRHVTALVATRRRATE